MHPEIFGFIKSYGLMLSLSFMAGIFLSIHRGKRYGIAANTIIDLVFSVLVSSIIGVRLFYVLTHLEDYSVWYRVFFVWDGGLTLYGGIILSTLTVWWMVRRQRLPFLQVADVLAPGVALGIGITRIGCFLSGCCYGKPTDSPWAVCFPAGSPATHHFGESCVHPSQLYGSAGGFLIVAILLLWERRPAPAGATFGRFLILYGLARFLIDFSRYYEPQQMMALGLSNNQWISLAFILGGTLVIVRGYWMSGDVHARD